jgi:ribonuclease J
LKRHATLAKMVGIPTENTIVVENGQVVVLADGKLSLGERIPGGYIFVEGESVGLIDLDVMHEREQLARSGIVLVNIMLDKFSNRLLKEPEVLTRGFLPPDDCETLVPSIRRRVSEMVNSSGIDDEKSLTDSVRSLLRNQTGRRPMVFIAVTKT